MLNCYYMDYTGGCSEEQSLVLYEQLNDSRKTRVDKIKNPDMKKKQILTGAFVQHCLSKELGINAANLRLAENEYGKPYVVGEDIYFNLSHSGKYAVLAVSDSNVGIDIECKTKDCMKLAKRFFCKAEYEKLLLITDEDRRKERFLEYWTIKEAYVKCEGFGLTAALNSFLVNEIDGKWVIEYGDIAPKKGKNGNKDVGVEVFDFPDKYKVAVCTDNSVNFTVINDVVFNKIDVNHVW